MPDRRRGNAVEQFFRRRQACPMDPDQRGCDLFRRPAGEQSLGKPQVFLGNRFGQDRIVQETFLIARTDGFGGRRRTPGRDDIGR